jgi:flavin-dependent dehydrogenase
LGVSGYGWIFPVAVGLELVKLNVGVGVWIDEYNKRKVSIIMLFNEFIQRNQATK